MPSFPEITSSKAYSVLNDFRIIDVRQLHEFHGPLGRIKGAEHIPLSAIEGKTDELGGERPLLMVCRSGNRSGKACLLFQRKGFDNATNLHGGMIAWTLAGLPVERTELKSLGDVVESVVAWLAQATQTVPAVARERVEAILAGTGASITAPSAAALDQVLSALDAEFRQVGAPTDLEIIMDAYRRDLAVL